MTTILRGFSSDEFEQIEAKMKKASISYKQFARMADQAIQAGLLECCAPYWVDEERKYIVKSNLSDNVFLMSQQEASFYLLGLLEAAQTPS
jgi:hypothetical protein